LPADTNVGNLPSGNTDGIAFWSGSTTALVLTFTVSHCVTISTFLTCAWLIVCHEGRNQTGLGLLFCIDGGCFE